MSFSLTIVSHNIFWGQGAPYPGPVPPDNPVPAIWSGLVGLYKRLKPDILCLQEIQTRQIAHDLAVALEARAHYCPGRRIPCYGGGIFGTNAVISLTDSQTTGSPVQRMWQKVKVGLPRNRELIIGHIHLPSARQVGAKNAEIARQQEVAEFLSQGVPPDIITGDFNELPRGKTWSFMSGCGYQDAALLGKKAAGPTTINGARCDYMWVRQSLAGRVWEYHVATRQECRLPGPSPQYLSDHLPVMVKITF